MGREYCVYIMTNIRNTVLYTGVTLKNAVQANNLQAARLET